MQSSTNPPDSPTLSDSSKKKTNSKRAKASVACHECRKRKVKCEGVQPCGRCRKSNFRCIFPQQQSSKRGPPKQYIEILEARLQLMEKALRTIGGPAREILDDALSLDPHALQDRNGIQEDDTTIQQPNEFHATSIQRLPDQYTMNEIGQPYYTHDIYHLRRQPSDLSLSTNNDIKSEPTTPVPSTHHLSDIDTTLIDKYFEHVHPYTPIIHKQTFNQQMMNPSNPPPMLLLYSMCAVAARWSNTSSSYYTTHSNEPPGFSYYQRAFVLIDEASVAPRITTIQALVLLTKYQEHYKRAGYFYRPGYYLALAVDMCYALKLSTLTSGESYDYEAGKRTFWMTFLYDLWTSIEEGRETRFTNSQCTTEYPSSSGDDGPGTEDIVTRHNVVIRLGRTLSDIYGFSRRLASRQQVQGTVRTSNQQMEENGRLVIMQTTLETFMREISAIPRFEYAPSTAEIGSYPADTTNTTVSDAFVGFLHMMYHYTIILLHRHHVLYPITNHNNDSNLDHTHPYPHQQLCATSASIINSIAESIMDSNSLDVFHYPIRGVQFTILCVTMAIAVHKFEMETTLDEPRKSNAHTLYWQALSIINRLSSETPAVELRYLAKDAELAEMCGKLAMDSTNTQSTLQQPLSPGSSSFTTTTTNNDGSSTSSSPILSSSVISTSTGSVADRINRPTKLTKPRRGTISGSHSLKRFSSQIFTADLHHHHSHNHHQVCVTSSPTTPTTMVSSSPMTAGQQSPSSQQQHSPLGSSSTVNPAALFNSSASITDPARLASMMQFGNIPLTSYNHHQQPLQLPTQSNNINSSHQQQALRRAPRPLHHHYSHSQEDLRSLNHRHMNKTGYARAASPGAPLEGRLKKHRSMKFLPMHSQQLQHTVRQYPPPSSLQQPQTHLGQPYQVQHHQHQSIQQNMNQAYQSQQQQYHQHHHVQAQPSYAHQQHLQQQPNHHHSSSACVQQHEHQYSSQNYLQQGAMAQQMNFPTTTSPGSSLQRRHTISFTGMDGFISPMANMDYASPNSSMMQLDTIDQSFRQDYTLPSTSSPSSPSSQQHQHQPSYTPMMEDDPQMMLMDPNAMHHLLADSTLSWGNGSLDMDRKAEGHVLQ